MAFFKTSRAESNEVVKAEDITFNFDSQVSNFSVLLQSLIDPTSNFVVGGKVSVLSGMNLTIDPILGCAKDTGICFVSTEKLTEGVAVSASESQDRIDIVQIKAIEEDYDEQQRSFIDFETKIETIQNAFTKKRVILQVEVKKGTAGAVISPTTDFGFVKLAEIFVPANSTSIDEWNIYNITSNYKGEENENWTNEIAATYNFQYLSEINKEFQNEHNKDGTHKQKVIGSAELDYGVGNNQVNTSILPLGTSISVDNNQLSASTTTTRFLSILAEKISTIFEDYYNKGGVYNFNGEIKTSDVFEGNALTKALKIKCDGNGSAFFYVNEKIVFTITETGKFVMPSNYSATASNDVITKAVSDAIYAEIKELEITIDDILNNNAANPAFVNGVFSRFSFSSLDVTVATTENISLFGEQTIDGIPLAANNVVLVKNQTDAKENGIYWVNIGKWDRHADFVDFDSLKNKFFTIGSGLINKGKVFYTNQQMGTLETDELNFVESFFKNAETKNTVPIRDYNGNIKTGTPSATNDAAPKKYVDDAETKAKNLENATGVLAVAKGGTGKTTLKDSANVLLNGLETEASTPSDGDYYISQYVNGGTTTTTYHRRPVSALWEYIKGKISSLLKLTATSYGGKAATAGTADTAKACTGNSATATKATLDGSGNNIVNTYATKTALSNQIAAVKDALMPIGFVYTQWPLTKSPTELKFPGTWSDVSWKYKGLFPRVDGGDAVPFNKTLTVASQSGTTLTFASGHGIIKGCMLINTVNGEQRNVTAVTENTVTIDSAFTTTITTVLIGQSEGLPNITGTASFRPISDASSVMTNLNTGVFLKSEAYKKGISNNFYAAGNGSRYNAVGVLDFDASLSNSIYNNSTHVTPNNATLKVWQRIS